MSEIILSIDGVDPLELYGEKNSKLNIFRQAFPNITITSRGNNIKITGEKKEAQKAKGKFEMMVRMLKEQHELSIETIKDLLNGNNPFDSRISNGDTSNTKIF